MKLYRCRGKGCKVQLTELEVKELLPYYKAYYKMCPACREKVSVAAKKATEVFGRKLRQAGQYDEDRIQGEMRNFREKILGR